MGKLNHTPGPWELLEFAGSGNLCKVIAFCQTNQWNIEIARVTHEDPDEQTANARLIAAAPEMLDFLIRIVSRGKSVSVSSWLTLYEREIAIIEKVTGQKIEDLT